MSGALAKPNLDLLQLAVSRREDDARPQPLREEVTQLFTQLRPALLQYLSTFGLPQQDGEEIVQEVFLSLFAHLQRKGARTNLRGWLFRVAHNLALKRRFAGRKETGIAADPGNLRHPDLNPEEKLARAQRQQRLSAVLDALPEGDRRCLYLRAEGLRYREIAAIVGMSLGFVAASLERSFARLQRADQR